MFTTIFSKFANSRFDVGRSDDVLITAPHRRGTARGSPDLARSQLDMLLKDPDGFLLRNLDRPVKLDFGAWIVQAELELVGGRTRVAFKRYQPRNRWKALLGLFRPGRAWKAWRSAQALESLGINSGRPLAVCDIRRPWRARRSYLALEWIESSENLHLWGWRLASCEPSERERRASRCAESLGSLLGKMHARGLVHGDLKGSNLLVVESADALETYVIDLDDVRPVAPGSLAAGAADLARLSVSVHAHPWVSRAARRRFQRAYAAQFPEGSVDWDLLWREVDRRAQRIIARKRRRGQAIL